jgi:hypothetical protein
MTNKQEAIKVISNLPDSADFEDMMYSEGPDPKMFEAASLASHVLEQIQKGQEDIKQGKTTSIADLEVEVSNW